VLVNKAEVDYVDVSPKQLVSVARLARALPRARRRQPRADGRQHAAPVRASAGRSKHRYVGTGMEGVTARDSGAVILAKRNGIVDSVDSERIIVRVEGEHHPTQLSREVGSDIYQLIKFKRSNQNTCINQKPIVRTATAWSRARSSPTVPCTEQGELGLGRKRARRLHALARLQLRGRHPHL
jgi:DNA-directed RNA polymerase subunit beta